MEPAGLAPWAIAVAIMAHAVAWLFKTPKETQGELAARVNTLDTKHHALDRDYAGFRAQVLTELHNIANAIEGLTAVINDKWPRSPSGEHRVLR